MPAADFVHLRVHSAYSLSEGAIKLKELPKLCRKLGMPAVAVTDTGNLFGALEFASSCAAEGIQPIIGCILGLRAPTPERGSPGRPLATPDPEPILLLAQSEAGYFNLVRLVSRSYMETGSDEAPQLALDDLAAQAEGLLCLTGGPNGPVGRRLAEGRRDAAEAILGRLAELFPGRLYVELQRHDLDSETAIEPALIDLAYGLDLPLVATNDAHFAGPEFHEAHDALLCIAQGTTVNVADRRRLTPDHHFKSAEAMRSLFADLPEACDNTITIARRCAFVLTKRKPILPPFDDGTGRAEPEIMTDMALAGLERRFEREVFPRTPEADRGQVEKTYRDRLDFELKVIIQMGFPGYFLIVADFIQWAKRHGIPVGPGRGSGAGSLVAWALSITDIDPLPYNLLFERFLNPERVSMPDFDVDFCQDKRDLVLRYVQTRYGHDRVAQIITFGKLQARAVLRDVGRVLEMPYGLVDKICKLVPNNPAKPVTLKEAVDGDPQLQQMRDGEESVGHLMNLAMQLEGLYRHASTHAAGVVIGDRPLDSLVALYRDPRSDMPVTQFNMKYVEDAGLVKFDFLGLKTLTVIDGAVKLVGSDLDISLIPLDDKATYEMLARGDTVGVFQLEGAGMRDTLKKLRPTRFEDIIAVISLYRPGPMENIDLYLRVRHGLEPPDYMHPKLQEILEETFGIMIYQEQVMQIAQTLAGYSLGGADLLRRAMGKKIKAEMELQRKTFVEGATANGVEPAQADHIFDRMAKFAEYGFNKSHAAAYALVAYQTAWLKANHVVEFLAASMTLDLGNTDKLNVFRQELQRLEIPLLPPDVNRSEAEFTVDRDGERPAVRYALAAVKGVGKQAMDALVAERERGGPFKDPFDLAERLDTRQFNKKQFECLAKAGALDSLDRNRARCFGAAEVILRYGQLAAEQRESNQIGLFGGSSALARPSLPAVSDWPLMERLQHEMESIGFYLSAHPLDPFGPALTKLGVVPSGQIPAHLARHGAGRIRLAGIVVGRKERTSAQGKRFAFVQMRDLGGLFEATLFSEVLAPARPLLDSGRPLLMGVDVKAEGEGSARLTVQSVELLEDAAAALSAGLEIVVDPAAGLVPLQQAIEREGKVAPGKRPGRLRVVLANAEREVAVALPGGFQLGASLRAALSAIPGVVDLRDF
jgi:DNA polymerase-3 subunit alpha